MTSHISDELPRMLTGDAPREVVLEAALHLRNCADCQQDLVSAVVAHASLMSAHRFAPEIVAPGEHDTKDDVAPVGPLPDLSDMFSKVHKEAEVPTAQPRRRRALIAVAAAAVVAGGGVTVAAITSGSDAPASHTVALVAFKQGIDTHFVKGKNLPQVQIVDNNRLKVNATALPKLDSTHQYEVWLTDADRKHMAPVGAIRGDNTADLPIPTKVHLSQYNAIEVSIQGIDQAKYSGISVLRGSYS